MTKNQNFHGQTTPSIVDTEYVNCNFSQPQPVFVGGQWRGVRIFPGDDTPRSFVGCNLVNCEVPPGSYVRRGSPNGDNCNTAIVQGDISEGVVESTRTGPRYERGVLIPDDGSVWGDETIATIVHGFYDADNVLRHHPTPRRKVHVERVKISDGPGA